MIGFAFTSKVLNLMACLCSSPNLLLPLLSYSASHYPKTGKATGLLGIKSFWLDFSTQLPTPAGPHICCFAKGHESGSPAWMLNLYTGLHTSWSCLWEPTSSLPVYVDQSRIGRVSEPQCYIPPHCPVY